MLQFVFVVALYSFIQAFMNKVASTEMPLLEQRLSDSNAQLCFLVDFVTLSPLDMELNAQTFQWLKSMPNIFKDHRKIISQKTEQYQSSLKVCFSTLTIQPLVCSLESEHLYNVQ